IYTSLILIASLCGAGIAGRQIWLQHLPEDKIPECGPGLEYMLDTFPFTDALRMILSGSGECAEVQWTFLSFSIAEWSIVCFTGLTIACLISLIRRK
ncbi:MAG: disulfide bond formation protein B, partial [Gammaproteobacteria bacterium]